MKKISIVMAFIIMIGAINYLYRLQLGAIPFLFIAIIFFILAFQQLFSHRKTVRKKKNDERI